MKAYLLKEGELDGIFTGVGIVEHGVPVIPRTEEQEELLSKHPHFKVTRIKAEEAGEIPLASAATVAPIEAEAGAEAEPAPSKAKATKGGK